VMSSGGVSGGTGSVWSGLFLLCSFSAVVSLLCFSMSVQHSPMYG
jgi:hypothetical protein